MKKPHQKTSPIKKTFEEVRKRTFTSKKIPGNDYYEVQSNKDGHTVTIKSERSADKILHFKTKKELDAYLKSNQIS